MKSNAEQSMFDICIIRFGQGRGAIYFSEVDCSGDDIHILHCQRSSNISHCNHENDVGLICCE